MKTKVIAWVLAACFLSWLVIAAVPRPASVEKDDPLNGIVYFKNPVTGKLALYISFELQPNHQYAVQVTDDGVTWSEAYIKSTKGAVNDVYLSYSVDPCNGIWPRVIDLGASP